VFLAWSRPEEIDRWLGRARPPLRPAEIDQHRRVLEVVRARGYAIGLESPARRGLGEAVSHLADDPHPTGGTIDDLLAELVHVPYHLTTVEESRSYDVSMIAAPIFDATRRVTAAITVSGLTPALPAVELIRVGERVRGAALIITKRTHGHLPPERS
jgi:DNA-binding IclR family transcriptional regulator